MWKGVCHLAEGVCAVSQLLQHRGVLPQVVVGVAQVHVVTHHGHTQLVVEPADTHTQFEFTFNV